ncbi:hypothetical protein CQW49_22770 (plasmid) [Methylosinus trichosporium OB3b]|uniref:Uncharacterized protein n=1 Tax=Methylosinus trichosporium (strain ATCC 35070 / NCIMB 11131 / UNIQEM 75 / OB3b) TaxID=595536 RepID=A0A2D2D707_METT3|nr:hypothetical protein CQW49_22770 [Methylosinus trichosporium OB3b]
MVMALVFDHARLSLPHSARQLPEPNPQPMRGAVIDESKPQWPVRKDGFVEGSEGDAAPNAIGIFYRDFVLGRTVSQRGPIN